MVADHTVCGPGKLNWVLMVALAGCQPLKMGIQNGVAAEDAMGGW